MRAAKWIVGRALRLIPESVRGRVLPGAFRFDPSQRPEVPVARPAPTRLLIAPVNYAGQGMQWARALREHAAGTWAMNMVVRTPRDFRHPADLTIPLGFYAASTRWQKAAFASVAAGFSHVMIEAEKQPFGAVLDETTTQQARRLRRHGVGVVMLCHGTDVRSPRRHMATEPYSPFRDAMKREAVAFERIAAANRRTLDEIAAPVLVSTPGLLDDVPDAQWLPVVVDVEAWRSDAPVGAGARLVVAHAPSNSAVKGSDVVDRVLGGLERAGLVEYRRLTGIPYNEMPLAYRDADVVVDQLRLGDYGVAACEAMAAGRLVVGHVSARVREYVRAAAGVELPILEADPSSLEEVMRDLAADHARAAKLAAGGVAFAQRVHDGRMSAAVLSKALARATPS